MTAKIGRAEAGTRLDVFLSGQGISRSQAKTLIESGHVLVNGARPAKAGTLLFEGDDVEWSVPAPRALDLEPRDADIEILFEDDDLAVVDKPAGLSVHPSATESGTTLVHALLHRMKSLSSVGGVERPGIVHRIDKGTSGVLVVSKTDLAHASLSAQFKAHTIDRRYLALVYGDMRKKMGASGKIDTLFGRNPKNRKKMSGKVVEGRRAITHWKILESLGPLTLVECKLETGRTHQIRAHLAEAGFPLVGDPLYGDSVRSAKALKNAELKRACLALTHQLLHARLLEFEHPRTGKRLKFDSEPPEDFGNVLEFAKRE